MDNADKSGDHDISKFESSGTDETINVPHRIQMQSHIAPASSSKQVRELKVEDALLYLDQVKMEFSDKPHIYNEFLEIMKNFKAQSINTPGVIERVKTLFRGYNKLILGFNTFLPEGEGYKIELSPEEQNIKQLSTSSSVENVMKKASVHPTHQKTHIRQSTKPPQPMQQQHAISYVTTIRNRFANEPETYRSFLKILHTYQKEQKGIKDVLEQVSLLFADHPDLLMEFTYFLPDAVQDQAKERLHRAARESEIRRRVAIAQQQQIDTGGILSNKRPRIDEEGLIPLWQDAKEMYQTAYQREILALQQAHLQRQLLKKSKQPRKQQQQQLRAQDILNVPTDYKNHPLLKNSIFKSYPSQPSEAACPKIPAIESKILSASNKKEVQLPMDNKDATSERVFFDKAKDLLLSTSRDSWSEFVKCIELFSTDAISKKDLFTLVHNLFGVSSADLFDEFKYLMTTREEFDASSQDLFFATPLSEIDFSQCRKCSPSYRALPKDYPKLQFSERSDADVSVLNDIWMSIPIGSEETYSFKHMRKNQYEEALFKCEDEIFEIDMIIDTNMSTIRILESLYEEIRSMPFIGESQFTSTTGDNSKFNLHVELRNVNTVHLSAISRVYGDHGSEIIELLKKNPVGTIPILLIRLNQKDSEWKRVRQSLNKLWKEIIDKNFEKSFDHRSCYFRQQDKRFYSTKFLISDIKTGILEPGLSTDDMKQAGVFFSPLPSMFHDMENNMQMAITYASEDFVVHKLIYRLFCHVMEASNLSHIEKEKICVIWRDMIRVFFRLPIHFFQEDKTEGMYTLQRKENEIWSVGANVITVLGPGKILGHRPDDGIYKVQLAFGTGYVKSSRILGLEDASDEFLSSIGLKRNDSGAKSHNDGSSNVLYGTQLSYIFLRIHQTIFNRLSEARGLAIEQASEGRDMSSVSKKTSFKDFLCHLAALLDGTVDFTRYEESSRHILGNKAYCVFTLDKLFQRLLKCIHMMSADENMTDLIQLYMHFSDKLTMSERNKYYDYSRQLSERISEDLYKLSHISLTSNESRDAFSFIGIQTIVIPNKNDLNEIVRYDDEDEVVLS